MLLILFATVLVLGVAFYQAVQGLYSAIIMAILTVCCAVLAFHFYEPLGDALLYSRQPEYADAIALIALFILPLLGLRLLFDKVLGANALTGMWTDRIAGGLVGLVTAQVMIGVLMIAIQMLPFGTSILGFVPFNDSLKRDSGLFPYPDEFTVGLVNTLSAGKPGGESSGALAPEPAQPYGYLHDDLLLELFCARNTAKDEKDQPLAGSLACLPGGLTVLGAFAPTEVSGNPDTQWMEEVPSNPLLPESASTKVLIVRAQLDEKSGAQDADKFFRLPGTHFRLVSKNGKSFYPVGYLTYVKPADMPKRTGEKYPWMLIAPADNHKGLPGKLAVVRPDDVILEGEKSLKVTIDWVYRVPSDEAPEYMVFRKVAKAAVPAPKPEMPDPKGTLDRRVPR